MILVAAWWFGFCSAANAQDEDDDAPPVVAERQFVMTEQKFDQMVFGGAQSQVARVVVVNGVRQVEVNAQSNSENAFRNRVGATITAEIQAIDERVSLTEAQRKKLRLASRIDAAQYISRVAELRLKLSSKPLNQPEYSALMRELQPLRMTQQCGMLTEESLFWKTLRRTLTAEQRVQIQALERERRKQTIESALLSCEQTAKRFVLMGETRRKFVEVILEHGRVPQNVGPYARYVVLLEANLLRDRVKPLLSEAEWEKFEWQVGQAKRVEPTLESYGIWTARRSESGDEETDDETKDGR